MPFVTTTNRKGNVTSVVVCTDEELDGLVDYLDIANPFDTHTVTDVHPDEVDGAAVTRDHDK